MKYGTDPVAQSVEDHYWGSEGVAINTPAGQLGYQSFSRGQAGPATHGRGQHHAPSAAPGLSPREWRVITRRVRNRCAFEDKAPLLQRLLNRVPSVFTGEGRFIVDQNGDLGTTVVPRQAHLDRLTTAYTDFWRARLEEAQASGQDEQVAEARERLALIADGLFVTPRGRRHFTYDGYIVKRRPFWRTARVTVPRRTVGASHYDRHLRLFAVDIFSPEGGRLQVGPHRLEDIPGAAVARAFFGVPTPGGFATFARVVLEGCRQLPSEALRKQVEIDPAVRR